MDYLFTNGNVLNSTLQVYEPKAVLTHNGKITMIGTAAECRNFASQAYETIDLKGKLLLPAFVDSHTHFVEYAKNSTLVNLKDCQSLDEIRAYLINYRNSLTWDAKWILGGSWDRNRLAEPMQLNRWFLDTVFPDKPVALMSRDYHSKLCNSLALKLAGIDDHSPDPKGGKIERDSAGIPTGVLYETASEMVDAYVQDISPLQIVKSIHNCVQGIYKLGLIGFHSMESKHSRELLLQAQANGSRFRMCWHFPVSELDSVAKEGVKSYNGNDFYQVGGMKIFGDGSLGSHTAAMFQPYTSIAENLGILRYSNEELYRLMLSAAERGFSSTIHAIGNKCVRQVIDMVFKLNKQNPKLNLMHRIEHVQSLRLEDIPLLKASGLFASVQPLHLANDVPMIEKLWHDIQDQVYSFKSMLDAGIALGFGSDSPIESINPFLGIYSAVERRPALNPHLAPFRAEQALSPIQAILGYTLGAAKSSQMQHLRGSIEMGKLADLIVLDDYRKQPSTFWLNAQSQLTMIGGEIVHSLF
ncbi:MAG: amidohydrolase [Candidatus Cloacimonetes bacterium]|nr:amidohydrolase [Candidatus Cloacimonadota bacterium]